MFCKTNESPNLTHLKKRIISYLCHHLVWVIWLFLVFQKFELRLLPARDSTPFSLLTSWMEERKYGEFIACFFFFFFLMHCCLRFSLISDMIECLSFCVWLISHCLMSSRSIHVVAHGRISYFFLRLNNIPFYLHHIFFFIHQTIDTKAACMS